MNTRNGLTVLAGGLLLVGAICIAGAIMYFTLPAHSLPGFMPGNAAHSGYVHTHRGLVLAVVGGAVLIGSLAAGVARNRRPRRQASW
jgi:hypothetical protein